MKAIQKIRDEHRSISAVLHALKQLAKDAQDARVKPGFQVFRAMIRYIDEFPEQLHHPKEDQYLFARLGQRAPQARPLIDELQAEHVAGAKLVRDLEKALIAFEAGGPGGVGQFAAAVDAYARFHWDHMRKEEEQILPLAEQALSAEDWRAIEEAFAGNEDPIADLREHDFAQLYERIVRLAPDPVGLGERWQRTPGR